jgi:hypothetical protein
LRNGVEGVKVEDNLVMCVLVVVDPDRAKRYRDEKEATRPVDRLGRARNAISRSVGAADLKKVLGVSFSLIIMGPPADILQVIDQRGRLAAGIMTMPRSFSWEGRTGSSGVPVLTDNRPHANLRWLSGALNRGLRK